MLRRIFGPKRDEVTGSGEDYITSSFVPVRLTRYHSRDQIKKTEMGSACSTCGGEEWCM